MGGGIEPEVTEQCPFLEVRGPDGQEMKVELARDHLKIGRFREFNDVALEPDPQRLVTKVAHCTVERSGGTWWVVDSGSTNRTFVSRGEAVAVVEGRAPLADGDVIKIVGKLVEGEEPVYWDLTFRDPFKTRQIEWAPRAAYLEYDWAQAKLFRVDGPSRQEISDLRPQEHRLIRYMDQRNRANDGAPVMCAYGDLIKAVWGEEAYHTEADVNHLVWELRRKLEVDPERPRFLQTVRGLGYRLKTRR